MVKATELNLHGDFSLVIEWDVEHEKKGKRFGEILPVPQVEPVYPVSHMHINVVTLQVPPYSQSESETQAPIKNHL